MEKAKKNEISTMTLEKAKALPLDGKEKDGKFTSLTLKRGLVKDDGKDYIERRVFKNADMKEVIVYDLALPLTLEQAKTMYGEADCLDALWTAKRIKTDGEKAGKGQADPIATGIKNLDKIVNALVAKGIPQAEAEKAVESAKKKLLASGFGK